MKRKIPAVVAAIFLTLVCASMVSAEEKVVTNSSNAVPGRADGAKTQDPVKSEDQSKRRLALGFTIDLLPIVMSAVEGEFGFAGQAWVGIDHVRIRLVGAHYYTPQFLIGNNGFKNQNTNTLAWIFDYVFGTHFDGWWVGTGFELWLNNIGHNGMSATADWNSAVWTVGGGYIWRFWKNLYIEPWAAMHVVMNQHDVTLGGYKYTPLPVTGEVSLKIGWFFDL